MQALLPVDSRMTRQRVVMQQLADMRQSASSLRERVAKLSGDVHPRMLHQVLSGNAVMQMPSIENLSSRFDYGVFHDVTSALVLKGIALKSD